MTNQELWAERVAQWQASGLSPARFCEDRDYSQSSLYYWIRKLSEDDEPPSEPQPCFARVVAKNPAPMIDEDKATPVLVDIGRARITVQPGAPRVLLEMVIDTLLQRTYGETR